MQLSRQQTSRVIGLVCGVCATGIGSHTQWPPIACEDCGRPVIHDTNRTSRHHLWRAVPTHRQGCRCTRPTSRACSICGVEFKPKRGHARYCSPACKQRAYRQRLVALNRQPPSVLQARGALPRVALRRRQVVVPVSGNGCLSHSAENRRNHMLLPWIISRRQKVLSPRSQMRRWNEQKAPPQKARPYLGERS
jgi:hypothetical protein